MTLLLKSFRTVFPDIKYTCYVRFLFTALLFCCLLITNVMIILIVSLLHLIFFDKEKLVLYCIMLRVIPLDLALLYRYYPLTLENILSLVVLLLL